MNIDKKYYEQIDIAKQDIKNNNFKDAINKLLSMINIYGEEKDILFELGKAYFLYNENNKSEHIFKKIVKYRNKDVYLFLIKILKQKGNNKDIKLTIKYLTECVELFYYDLEVRLEIQQTLQKIIETLIENKDFYEAFKIFFTFYRFPDIELKILKDFIYFKVIEYLRYNNIRNNKKTVFKLVDKLFEIIPINEIKIRNSLLNEKEIAEGKLVLASKPRKLQLILTNKCNLRCIMCDFHNYDWNFNNKQIKELKELIPYLDFLIWQGGEVFLSKYFIDIFELALKNDVKQTIITNGLLLNKNILKKIVQDNVSLAISIDDIEKKGYEKIRVGGKFENLISNLEIINSLREKNKKLNFNMQMSVVVMKSNYSKLGEFVDFAKKYGFSSLELNPIELSNSNYEEQIFFPKSDYNKIEYINKLLPNVYRKAAKNGIQINSAIPTLESEISKNKNFSKKSVIDNEKHIQNYKGQRNKYIDLKMDSICKTNKFNGKHKSFCFVPWYSLMIELNGYVMPSCICPSFCRDTIANMSINDVWNSKTMSFYRQIVQTNSYETICSKCNLGDITKNRRLNL